MTDEPTRRSDRQQREPDLGVLAARLLFGLQDELFARLAERGHDRISPRHGAILAQLDEDGLRATELARRSGRHKQIVGRLVDELEELGYVERRPDPRDRRAKLVVPTELGMDEIRTADGIIADIERRYAGVLGAEGYRAFRNALRTLVESSDTDAPAETEGSGQEDTR